MEKGSIWITIGMLIYLVMSIMDRFIVKIADFIYIPAMIVGIILMIIGIIKNRRNKE